MKDFEWFCLFFWGLWGNRNAKVHYQKVRAAEDLIAWVSGLLAEFQSTVSISISPCQSSLQAKAYFVPWSPPLGLLKLNSNAAVRPSCEFIGLRGTTRNVDG
ncbi:hypothetical protein ACOSP7_016880 [Xanthoceras sorbifolium]